MCLPSYFRRISVQFLETTLVSCLADPSIALVYGVLIEKDVNKLINPLDQSIWRENCRRCLDKPARLRARMLCGTQKPLRGHLHVEQMLHVLLELALRLASLNLEICNGGNFTLLVDKL